MRRVVVLPHPGRPQEADELSWLHVEVEVLDGDHPVELLAHALERQKSTAHRRFLRLVTMTEIIPIATQTMAKATMAIADGSYTLLRVRLAMNGPEGVLGHEHARWHSSPMTIAKVRREPGSTATRRLGKITRRRIVAHPAPRALGGLGQ